ncbi:hypothetical protein F4778DRAFT_780173 [Xylariomycetidae sp. FL2044]|nr:hypothetical protein F4778DRAFT_780173 [Xylariomycetidae sp. FL2044]
MTRKTKSSFLGVCLRVRGASTPPPSSSLSPPLRRLLLALLLARLGPGSLGRLDAEAANLKTRLAVADTWLEAVLARVGALERHAAAAAAVPSARAARAARPIVLGTCDNKPVFSIAADIMSGSAFICTGNNTNTSIARQAGSRKQQEFHSGMETTMYSC